MIELLEGELKKLQSESFRGSVNVSSDNHTENIRSISMKESFDREILEWIIIPFIVH